jgi:hypothetical protein
MILFEVGSSRTEEGNTEIPQPDEFSALLPELQLNAKTEINRIIESLFMAVQYFQKSAEYRQIFSGLNN